MFAICCASCDHNANNVDMDKLKGGKAGELNDMTEEEERNLVHITQTYKDGSMYQGYTRDGSLRHGRGKYTYPDGNSYYEGQFRNDKFNGFGTFKNAQSEYTGGWKNNLKHGRGEEVSFKFNSTYTGEYLDGKKHGQGVNKWQDGSVYEGQFYYDEIQGEGKYTSDKCTYVGRFQHNGKHGYGEYRWTDGRVYRGYFENDLKHGQGTLTWPDGYTYKGGFRKGVQHGQGTITNVDGSFASVKFTDGQQVKQ